MPWFFVGLLLLASGSNIELRASNPLFRPRSPMANGIWRILGGLSGLTIVVSFVAGFFVIPWWAVLLNFLLAGIGAGFLAHYFGSKDMAPLYSQLLMLIGIGATIFGLFNPQTALFV